MKTFVIPILAVALIAGCATHEGVYAPQSATEYNYENSEKFVLMDSGAQRSVTANSLREARLPDGRMDVAANVRNRENRRIQVQVNCEFKDAHGLTLDSTPWQTLILTENGQETIRFASMNSDASRYTIRIRQAR
ncbi:MAG TPA: YcfL family protein [Verrucomicrobiae bacterium]|nr:YcfL family protein [Verrucomicrobiae bacterium]